MSSVREQLLRSAAARLLAMAAVPEEDDWPNLLAEAGAAETAADAVAAAVAAEAKARTKAAKEAAKAGRRAAKDAAAQHEKKIAAKKKANDRQQRFRAKKRAADPDGWRAEEAARRRAHRHKTG